MPFVPADLIARLASLDVTAAAPPGEAFPARYGPAALPVLRAGLERRAAVRDVLGQLDPAAIAVDERALVGINDPAALARAEASLR
jgi:molybdopterin-guanine dinucleotide biosynthesis protein A